MSDEEKNISEETEVQTYKKKIVIGMTGKKDSTVAAYLLKKQGHDCIGVALLFHGPLDIEEEEKKALELSESGETVTPFEYPFSRCHIKDLERVKKVCDNLDIPLYAVNAQDAFNTYILEPVFSASLMGKVASPCFYCAKAKVKILMEKADLLGADYVATGHYAKVVHNKKTNDFSLLRANDLKEDQSYSLSGLGQAELKRLIFPLSEIRSIEVEKIKEQLQLDLFDSVTDYRPCLIRDPNYTRFVERNVAWSLYKKGSIFNYHEDTNICEHFGIHKYLIGENKIASTGSSQIDKNLEVVKIIASQGNIYLAYPQELQYSRCHLNYFNAPAPLDVSKPINAYVKFDTYQELVACKVYFKNINSVIIDFAKMQSGLIPPGVVAVIYNRSGEGAKILGGGTVKDAGFYYNGEFRSLPLTSTEKNFSSDDKEEVKETLKNEDLQF
jgi:tRNA-uridine 2-sulfurtransferase